MNLHGAKVLITGGAGFIGSHIVDSLVAAGAAVVVYDNFSFGHRENLAAVAAEVEVVEGDILDYEALSAAMKGVDYVSHHAAQLEIFKGNLLPFDDLRTNTIGTLNVLRAAAERGVKKVVNASSACVYGQVDGLTPEDADLRPNWEYGVSKLAAEKYGDIYNDYYGLPVVHLRYGIVYGEREWLRRVLSLFIRQALLGKPLVVFGEGRQVRDFVYVGDVVAMHNRCLIGEAANGQAYNVGSGVAVTVRDLAAEVIRAAGRELEVIHEQTAEGEVSKQIPGKKRNAAELKIMLLNVEKAAAELGWRPQVSLSDGIRAEMAWASGNMHRWRELVYSI